VLARRLVVRLFERPDGGFEESGNGIS